MDAAPSSLPREALLARALVDMADTLIDDFDVVEMLTRVAHHMVEVLGVDAAGLMLVAPEGDLRLAASTSEAMRLVELFELQAHEGPCLDCFRTAEPVARPDLASGNDRWPNFTPIALEAGFRSVHALPMRLRGQVIGAANLFFVEEGSMDAVDLFASQALADMATISILQHRAISETQVLIEQLHMALNSRVLIEQAKGVVSERSGVDMHRAFEQLRRYARNHNQRLVDVAQQIVERSLDTAALDPVDP